MYHSPYRKEENYFKIPPSWEYHSSLKRDGFIWSNLFHFLSHLPKTRMRRCLKMITKTIPRYSV